jgi:acyl dehydratase
MPLDYDTVRNWQLPVIVNELTDRDLMLYALSVGFGQNHLDERELRYCYEEDLLAVPTMGSVIGYPGFWPKTPGTTIDWLHVVHGEQTVQLHQAMPTTGTIESRTEVKAIVDKGPDIGAVIFQERELYHRESKSVMASVEHVTFCRGDGGFGGGDVVVRPKLAIPSLAPDAQYETVTLSQAALMFRLQGDRNPLHADPAVAKAAGYPSPILHGLVSYGVAGHAILATICDYDSTLLRSVRGRFVSPVYPGETLLTEIWCSDGGVIYRVSVVERSVTVMVGSAEVANS